MKSRRFVGWSIIVVLAVAVALVSSLAAAGYYAIPAISPSPYAPTLVESTVLPDQVAASFPPFHEPTSLPPVETIMIGESVEGRPLNIVRIGTGLRYFVVIAGLHGDEQNASALVQILSQRFQYKTLPDDVTLYFLAVANPDGYSQGSRLNANSVDLNRNWATSNWQSETYGPNGRLSLGGGEHPFSEPETIAIASWLTELAAASPWPLTVIFFHSAFPPNGLVLPSYTIPGGNYHADPRASLYGVSYAYAVQADFSETWDTYIITGEALLWCGENRSICLDIELASKEAPSASEILDHEVALFALVVNTVP